MTVKQELSERPKKPPQERALDDETLQQYLYNAADRFNHVTIHQSDLSQALLVSMPTLAKTLRRMEKDGRIQFIKKGFSGINTYLVINPNADSTKSRATVVWE